MSIGILYIALGKYSQFWEDFYSSSQQYLLPKWEKKYFVFTDCGNLSHESDTQIYYQEDLGWPDNTLFRFSMFSAIKEDLKDYDYLFFFNGNTLFLDHVTDECFLPSENENYLTVLSWDIYASKKNTEFPYDRNPNSLAYIPFGDGEKYYQGGLNGGRREEFLQLIDHCREQIEIDYSKGIVARNHDESHLNKYLLGKRVKVLCTEYGKPEEWKEPINPKIIFRDKNRVLGTEYINDFKGYSNVPMYLKIFKLLKRFRWLLYCRCFLLRKNKLTAMLLLGETQAKAGNNKK